MNKTFEFRARRNKRSVTTDINVDYEKIFIYNLHIGNLLLKPTHPNTVLQNFITCFFLDFFQIFPTIWQRRSRYL